MRGKKCKKINNRDFKDQTIGYFKDSWFYYEEQKLVKSSKQETEMIDFILFFFSYHFGCQVK